jgi:hypothetical protein
MLAPRHAVLQTGLATMLALLIVLKPEAGQPWTA